MQLYYIIVGEGGELEHRKVAHPLRPLFSALNSIWF